MAKKKRKKEVEAEKYEFKPPDFDEKQFLRDEMWATRRVILTVIYGSSFGVIAAAACISMNNASIGLLVMLFGFFLMKYIFPIMKLDLSRFTKKTWLESGAWFFFTFMAFWLLMFNPPFGDYTDPDIIDVSISVNDAEQGWLRFNYTFDSETGSYTWTDRDLLDRALYNYSGEVRVEVRVSDNSGLAGNPRIAFAKSDTFQNMTAGDEEHIYIYQIASLSDSYLYLGSFAFEIQAEDSNGHSNEFVIADSAQILVR